MARVQVDEGTLLDLAGELFFARGNMYFHSGQVRQLQVTATGATATVDGTRPYRVSLVISGGRLVGDCDCPVGQDELFCKHCVAVGLAWLAKTGGPVDGSGADGQPGDGPVGDELRDFLVTQEPEWLAGELVRAAADNPVLLARLQVAAGAERDAVLDMRAIRRDLESAIAVRDYIDWHGAASYLHDVDEALDSLDELTDNGFAAEVVDLAEYALRCLEDAAEMVDDSSDGGMGSAMRRAQEIHLRACGESKPDQAELGRRLAGRALGSDWEVFLDALPAYMAVLGDAGLTAYRAVIERAWSELPPLGPGDGEQGRYGRFTVTRLRENLARCDGGADALVEVLAHDLASPYQFVRIAQVLVEADRDAEALDWLERGGAAFPTGRDARLNHLAADIHRRDGRGEKAVELIWEEFTRSPSLAEYQLLADYAKGIDVWPHRRGRAVDLLRSQPVAAGPGNPRFSWQREPGHSTLVEVLLWENDIDAAWQAARHGGCTEQIWLRLARLRAVDHPLDAVPVLRRHAEAAIDGKKRDYYRAAATLLREARELHQRAGDGDGFAHYLRELRAKHRPKRALIEELDRAGLRA